MRKRLKLALIGRDVSNSDSEKIHTFILNELGCSCEYEGISLPKEDLDEVMQRLFKEFDGFNVTIPYKIDVIKYLKKTKGDACAFGAVNTVVVKDKTGYNTDGVGFMQMLSSAKIDVFGKKALVIGAGGAGRSTALSLKNAGASVYLYRRNREALKETCEELGVFEADGIERGGFEILVNATGVGMCETVGESPVAKSAFEGGRVAIDLIYKPSESEFLRLARERGLITLNGERMLFYQAYYSDCYYLEKSPDSREAEILYLKYLKTQK